MLPIRVALTKTGRGVIAVLPFNVDQEIERCPVIIASKEDIAYLEKTILNDYIFEWQDGCAVALGYGSLYNHSCTPNAAYEHQYDTREFVFYALRAITPGEEITVNYNGVESSSRPLWFKPI